MARRIGVLLIVAIAMIAFLCTAQAQTGEEKWKKTITLPDAEVILNISGELCGKRKLWTVEGVWHIPGCF